MMNRTMTERSMVKMSWMNWQNSNRKCSRKYSRVFFICETNVGIRIVHIFIWKYRKWLKSNVHISFLKLVVSAINVKKIILTFIRRIIWKNILKLGEFRRKKKWWKINSPLKLSIWTNQRRQKFKMLQNLKNQLWPSPSNK